MFSVLFGVCVQYIGMDLGSEYIKTAESTIIGEPKMKFSPNGGNNETGHVGNGVIRITRLIERTRFIKKKKESHICLDFN